MLTLLALAANPEVAEKVEKVSEQALGVVAQTALGATTLIALAVAVLSVWKLSSVQDKRAADAKESTKQITELVVDITKFQEESRRTIDQLVQAERNGEQVSREQTGLLLQIKQSIDTTLRDVALRNSGRSPTPSGGSPAPPVRGRY